MLLGKKLKKALALLTLISMLPNIAVAQESTGIYTRAEEGQVVPFNAWCFDDIAFATIKARFETEEERCQLKIDKALELQKARHLLDIGNLEVRLETLQAEYDSVLKIKNNEIENLEQAALERPNDYTVWWATGGFLAGAISVITVVLVVSK